MPGRGGKVAAMPPVAIVTGANQGLGHALVEGLCRALGPEAHVYLTARDTGRGEAAVRALRDLGLVPTFRQLDVTVPTSVTELADELRALHGQVDIVFSNAGARISPVATPAAQVRGFVDTNNLGTTRMLRAFGPLLADGGRFFVVASAFGSLGHLPAALHGLFDTERASLDDIDAAMRAYADAVEAGTAAASGWPDWINIPSKIGQVAAMRIYARDRRDEADRRGLLIDAVCPGLIDTDASRPWFSAEQMAAALSPAAGAAPLIALALLPRDARQPYGELIQREKIIRWQ
jgi:carbonyl reductase 1